MSTEWKDWYRGFKRQVRMVRRSLRAFLRNYVFKPRKSPTVSQGWVPPDLP